MKRGIQRLRAREGFTLIELLLVVAIIGVIAAILIPNLIEALQKARQKRAMTDLRSVGGGWFTWMTDQLSAAAAGAGQTYSWSDFERSITADELLQTLLSVEGMVYLQRVPDNDPWGNAYQFAQANDVLKAPDHIMGMRTLGQDGQEDFGGDYSGGPFVSSDFAQDIVWADGLFIRWPLGASAFKN